MCFDLFSFHFFVFLAEDRSVKSVVGVSGTVGNNGRLSLSMSGGILLVFLSFFRVFARVFWGGDLGGTS